MEPGTPTPVLKRGAREIPLAWTKRSEAILAKYGYDLGELFAALSNQRRALYAICLGLYAALPADEAPDDPVDINEWLAAPDAQVDAVRDLVKLIKHARPELFRRDAEKKSASKP